MSRPRPCPAKRPGRPTACPLTATIRSRVSQDLHDKYIALGGSAWLRKQIEAAKINDKEV